jgi:chemotaxis protein MotB
MLRRTVRLAVLPFLLCAGCTSVEPYEKQINELLFRCNAAEQAAEQATVDKRLAEREVQIQTKQVRVLQEKLALSYDALREARSQADEKLHDRLTELSQSTDGGQALQISQYGGIVLDSGIFFSSGQHDLTAAGKRALEGMVATLLKDEYTNYEVEVTGHTDSDPIKSSAGRYRDNHDLASLRANSVRRFLVERGLAEGRLYLSAWGPFHPLSPTDKAKNRRVEIVLHKRDTESPAALPASTPREDDGK